MTNTERIRTASEQLDRVQGGLDATQAALDKAESLAVAAEQVPRKARRVLLILLVGVVAGLAISMVLKKKKSRKRSAPIDGADGDRT